MTSMLLATPALKRSRAWSTSSLERCTLRLATRTWLRAESRLINAVFTSSAIGLLLAQLLNVQVCANSLGANAATRKQRDADRSRVGIGRDHRSGLRAKLFPVSAKVQRGQSLGERRFFLVLRGAHLLLQRLPFGPRGQTFFDAAFHVGLRRLKK